MPAGICSRTSVAVQAWRTKYYKERGVAAQAMLAVHDQDMSDNARGEVSPARSSNSSSSSEDALDLEKQILLTSTSPQEEQDQKPRPLEYSIPLATKLTALGGWFILNALLTIFNKATLNVFAFPWTLTVVHATCASIGTLAMLGLGKIQLTSIGLKDHILLALYSVLFTVNIAISNVSLALVSVPLHQTIRSTSPVVALLAYRLLFGRSYSTETYLSLLPIVFGVGLTAYGEYSYTAIGLFTTILGVVLAVAKTIAGNKTITSGRRLGPSEMLLRMAPYAVVQGLSYAFVTGELGRMQQWAASTGITWTLRLMVVGNGLLAFVLNVSSLHTNKVAGAVALSVAGNLKQCFAVLLGIVLFDVKVGMLNGTGIAMVLAGAVWYSKAELTTRRHN